MGNKGYPAVLLPVIYTSSLLHLVTETVFVLTGESRLVFGFIMFTGVRLLSGETTLILCLKCHAQKKKKKKLEYIKACSGLKYCIPSLEYQMENELFLSLPLLYLSHLSISIV